MAAATAVFWFERQGPPICAGQPDYAGRTNPPERSVVVLWVHSWVGLACLLAWTLEGIFAENCVRQRSSVRWISPCREADPPVF